MSSRHVINKIIPGANELAEDMKDRNIAYLDITIEDYGRERIVKYLAFNEAGDNKLFHRISEVTEMVINLQSGHYRLDNRGYLEPVPIIQGRR